MIRRINNEIPSQPDETPVDTMTNDKYDQLDQEAFNQAKRGEISVFQLDDISEMYDQQRAIDMRKQKLAQKALRRELGIPHPLVERVSKIISPRR